MFGFVSMQDLIVKENFTSICSAHSKAFNESLKKNPLVSCLRMQRSLHTVRQNTEIA